METIFEKTFCVGEWPHADGEYMYYRHVAINIREDGYVVAEQWNTCTGIEESGCFSGYMTADEAIEFIRELSSAESALKSEQ